mmetsp:Transcript_35648/g.39743  ORF Transcript_35648/g.39743 Transcript_35648/m.39743 type:complete len:146 (+) Transcript_35648:589-1026(+)
MLQLQSIKTSSTSYDTNFVAFYTASKQGSNRHRLRTAGCLTRYNSINHSVVIFYSSTIVLQTLLYICLKAPEKCRTFRRTLKQPLKKYGDVQICTTLFKITQQRKIEINDGENVIAFFEISTKPKVTIFDDKSTSIQFDDHRWSL